MSTKTKTPKAPIAAVKITDTKSGAAVEIVQHAKPAAKKPAAKKPTPKAEPKKPATPEYSEVVLSTAKIYGITPEAAKAAYDKGTYDPKKPMGAEWTKQFEAARVKEAVVLAPIIARVAAQEEGTSKPAVMAPVKNEAGVAVEKSDGGRYKVYGHSHTKIVMWMGANGWTAEEVQTAFKKLGLPEVSILSIRTFLRAGKNPEARVKENRGDVPTLTVEQAATLAKSRK